MHNHHITRAIAEAHAADLQRTAARNRPTASVRPRHRRRAIVAALIAIGALAPTAGAIARTPAQELRNPDNRVVEAARAQDFRSPDARDAAAGRGTFSAPDVTVVKLPRPMPVASDGGVDWGDVGLGAGGVLCLALLALGATFAIAHRRQGARRTATPG